MGLDFDCQETNKKFRAFLAPQLKWREDKNSNTVVNVFNYFKQHYLCSCHTGAGNPFDTKIKAVPTNIKPPPMTSVLPAL